MSMDKNSLKYENPEHLAQFEDLGFIVENTGGGCQWLRRPLGNGLSLCITDGEAGLPDMTAQLYLMSDRHSDPVMISELMTLSQMLDKLAQDLEVQP
jgi:hypothetical protein